MYTLDKSRQDGTQSYKLYRPTSWYRTKGRKLGFTFRPEEFNRAQADGGRLGVRRYMPDGEVSTSLPFPLGSVVECHLTASETVESVEDEAVYAGA